MSADTKVSRGRLGARAYIIALIAAAVFPVWLFAAYILLSYALTEQRGYRARAVEIAEQSAFVVDGKLREMQSRLDTLARVDGNTMRDLVQLYSQARSMVRGTGQAILAVDRTSSVLFDTRYELRASSSRPLTLPSSLTIASDANRVSGVFRDEASGDFRIGVTLAASVSLLGEVALILTVPTQTLFPVLQTSVPEGWTVGVGDAAGVYVTRSQRHDDVTGKPGLSTYLDQAKGNSGVFTANNQFGETLLAGYYRSPISGWLYGANVPLAVVEGPLWRSIREILAIAAATLLLSGALAFFFAKFLTREASQLSENALTLSGTAAGSTFESRVREFAVVGDEIRKSHSALLARTRELQAVLETAPVAVWFTYDPSGRKVIRNPYAAELMELPKVQGAFGVPDIVIDTVALKDGRTISREDRPLTRAMRGEMTDREEFLYRLPSGREIVLLSSARSIWDDSDSIIGAVQVSLDITERKRSEEQRRLLSKELNHRVKNNLAIVLALVHQTIRNSNDLYEAGQTITERIGALARGHDVLTEQSWTESDLGDLIKDGFAAQIAQNRVATSGPRMKLDPSHVMAVTLALHELATNAVKYGALSDSNGVIAIRWECDDNSTGSSVRIIWKETGGPPVKPPATRGFGSRLIKRMAESTGGSASFDFREEGLTCVLTLPRTTLSASDGAEKPSTDVD